MRITFFGGAGEVTGSKHLVEIGGARVLLDCGFHQGHRKEARDLNSSLPFDAATIDAVVLSHAHLDHCGMLPLLVKNGYKGKIYATSATRDVAEWILLDAAHIQENDFKHLERHKSEGAGLAKPLYTADDIPAVLARFVKVPYARNAGTWTPVINNIELKLYDAGHILGSSVIVLQAPKDRFHHERLVFTGDLGRNGAPLIPDPEYVHEETEVLLTESTYGSRVHQDFSLAKQKLKDLVHEVVQKKGKLIIPAFALGRTQELVYILHQLTDAGEIPRIPIFVDSPLADRVTGVFRAHEDDLDIETWQEFGAKDDAPLSFRNLLYTRSVEESKQLNAMQGPVIIIASSGMCEGGRILHHLLNGIHGANNIILFTGYQAMNTLGRRIIEGEKKVRIYDEYIDVKARIEKLNELSAHADRNELLAFAERIKGLKKVFLVHGEYNQAAGLKSLFEERRTDWDVRIPRRGESTSV